MGLRWVDYNQDHFDTKGYIRTFVLSTNILVATVMTVDHLLTAYCMLGFLDLHLLLGIPNNLLPGHSLILSICVS